MTVVAHNPTLAEAAHHLPKPKTLESATEDLEALLAALPPADRRALLVSVRLRLEYDV